MRLLKRLKGVSYIEALLALPVFIILIIAAIDFAWYVAVYVIFSYASHTAVDLASKVQIETPTSVDDCATDAQRCADYEERVGRILNRALNIALTVSSDSSTDGKVQLIPYKHYDVNLYNASQNRSGIREMVADIGFIRPGETLVRDPDGRFGETTRVEHPTRIFGDQPRQGWPQTSYNEKWEDLLRDSPVVIMINARYRPFLPFFPDLTVTATQYAYRRVPEYGQQALSICGDGVCDISEIGIGACCPADCGSQCASGGTGGGVAGSGGGPAGSGTGGITPPGTGGTIILSGSGGAPAGGPAGSGTGGAGTGGAGTAGTSGAGGTSGGPAGAGPLAGAPGGLIGGAPAGSGTGGATAGSGGGGMPGTGGGVSGSSTGGSPGGGPAGGVGFCGDGTLNPGEECEGGGCPIFYSCVDCHCVEDEIVIVEPEEPGPETKEPIETENHLHFNQDASVNDGESKQSSESGEVLMHVTE